MTSVQRTSGGLPGRLLAAGWRGTIYTRGLLADPAHSVAIVGARAATGQGMARAHDLARHLASRGIHVVSGGALGIDGAAHRGAMVGGGTTTVVLGCGVDVAYPARHESLFAEVLARGGALVSMWPDRTQPRRGTFLRRNRLIAALADLVVVIEANHRSGSLTTAAAATQLGRRVAAWPGSRGCDLLLTHGAAIIEDAADLDAALGGSPRFPEPFTNDPISARVSEALAAGARGVDQIVSRTGLTVRAVVRALTMLESPFAIRGSK